MCKVNEKTYVYPNGEEKLVETVQYCSKSNKKTLCNSYERIPMGPFFVHEYEPELVEDDGFGTPSTSGGVPATPTSTAGVGYRSPSDVERPHSSKGRRLLDASKLKISFKKDSSKRHGHQASASGSSHGSSSHQSHTRQTSSGTAPIIPLYEHEMQGHGASNSSPISPSADDSRRRRFRTVIDHDPMPNPPPSSSSGGTSLSGHASPVDAERADPRMSESDRRAAKAMNDQQRRQQRRQEKARATDRQAGGPGTAEYEAREQALDEQARREWERGNAREEIRQQKAARRAQEEEEQGSGRPEYYRTSSNQDMPTRHQRRRSSTADQAFVNQLRHSMHVADATQESVDAFEDQRRRSVLEEQLRSGRRAGGSSASNSDTSEHRAHRVERTREPELRQKQRASNPPVHRSPPVAYESYQARMPGYPGYTDSAENNSRSWHQSDVSARNPNANASGAPRRRASITRPGSSSGRHDVATQGEYTRPGSRGNAAWTQDPEAFRRRGEQVLGRARARGEAVDRAQEVSFRMSDAMFDAEDDDNNNYPPEGYYRRPF